jgi:hypothetical protein
VKDHQIPVRGTTRHPLRPALAPLILLEGLAVVAGGRRYLSWQEQAIRSGAGALAVLGHGLPDLLVRLAALFGAVLALRFVLRYVRRSAFREETLTTHFDAAPATVFRISTDPRKRFLTANPIARMSVVGPQTAGVGTIYRWTFSLPFGPTFRFDEMIVDWIEDRRVAYRAISGWTMEASSALEPEDGGTRYTFAVRGRFPGVWRWLIAGWMVRLGCQRAMTNLRRLVEAETGGGEASEREGVPVLAFQAEIGAPSAAVFQVVGDPRSKLFWVAGIKRVEMLSAGPLGPGTLYLTSSGIGPIELPFREEIVAWEPPSRVAYRGGSPWGRFHAAWSIQPTALGSRVDYRMDYAFPGGRLGRFGGGLAARLLGKLIAARAAKRLTALVERYQRDEPLIALAR